MLRRKLSGAALPAMVAATPMVVGAARAYANRSSIWFWGDQALIDIEARNSLLGRNLLGVYDRYGWHHLGPLWLLLLGVFRWVGGGAPVAVVVGSYVLQAVGAAAIVFVACRLRPGLTGWWAALVVLGYEWSFGLERLGTVWAPYAIALPAALLVLLVADVAASPDPWPPAIATAICATFLCQTDIGTIVLVAVLVLAAPLVRLATRVATGGAADGSQEPRSNWSARNWGWATDRWRRHAATLAVVLGVLWLPPLLQQVSSSPGNLVQVYRFVSTHHAVRTWRQSLRAADTLFGSFPFRTGERGSRLDATPTWLLAHSAWDHPWYLLYVAGAFLVGAFALADRQVPAFALAASSFVAVLAAGWSILLVYGPLYPYLIIWTGALVVPAWIAVWLLLAPLVARWAAARRSPIDATLGAAERRLAVPMTSLAVATAVCVAFAVGPEPMTSGPSRYARTSWKAVAAMALAPNVRTVYLDITSTADMPEAAAIADQVVRHGRRVEIDKSALYFVDPSFAPKWAAQLRILVCCGRGDPDEPGDRITLRAKVDGQGIYTFNEVATAPRPPFFHQLVVPHRLPIWPPGFSTNRLDIWANRAA